jgi:hypothetical protein
MNSHVAGLGDFVVCLGGALLLPPQRDQPGGPTGAKNKEQEAQEAQGRAS